MIFLIRNVRPVVVGIRARDPDTERVLRQARRLVLTVPPPTLQSCRAEYRRFRETMASTELEALVRKSHIWSKAPTTRLRHGKPYVQILDVAAEENSDLIAVGVHGRNPLDLMLFGSTANQVVRRATCPVLTLQREASANPEE